MEANLETKNFGVRGLRSLRWRAAAAFGLLIAGVFALRLLAGVFKKLGCEVDHASDGHEAVEMARARAFDLIFLDILMPVCDGVEATLRIREIEKADPLRPPAFIVALTADAFAENRDRCLAAGMDDFLTKPVKVEAIRAVVERVARSGPAG